MGMNYGIDYYIDILDVVVDEVGVIAAMIVVVDSPVGCDLEEVLVDIAMVVGTVVVVLCFESKGHNQFVGYYNMELVVHIEERLGRTWE
jgi:hypothetical protein